MASKLKPCALAIIAFTGVLVAISAAAIHADNVFKQQELADRI